MEPLFPIERLRGYNNIMFTQALFYEFKPYTGATDTPYTLKDRDYKGCISMHRIYMECNSEYEAAMVLLGSWAHWEKLCRLDWFQEHVEKWREEREYQELAIAKRTLVAQAAEGNVTAAKALLDGDKKKTKRGRPSKAEIEAEKRKALKDDNKVVAILERMGENS